MRRVAAALGVVCLVSLSACSGKQGESQAVSAISTEGTPVTDGTGEMLKFSVISTLGLSNEQLLVQSKMAQMQGDMLAGEIAQKHLEVRSKMGRLKDIDLEQLEVVMLEDGSYTASVPVIFQKGTMLYVLNLNEITQQIQVEFTDMGAGEADASLGALMESATVYSAMGIGTVFAVLIFISLLIACFKFIYKWESGGSKKGKAGSVPEAAPVPAPAESEELCDDRELAAVITAAIAAYEGTSSNGLVVRSIRRVKGSAHR